MTQKAGNLPAWIAVVAPVVISVITAGAAYGAISAEMTDHDDEIVELKADLKDLRDDLRTTGLEIRALRCAIKPDSCL